MSVPTYWTELKANVRAFPYRFALFTLVSIFMVVVAICITKWQNGIVKGIANHSQIDPYAIFISITLRYLLSFNLIGFIAYFLLGRVMKKKCIQDFAILLNEAKQSRYSVTHMSEIKEALRKKDVPIGNLPTHISYITRSLSDIFAAGVAIWEISPSWVLVIFACTCTGFAIQKYFLGKDDFWEGYSKECQRIGREINGCLADIDTDRIISDGCVSDEIVDRYLEQQWLNIRRDWHSRRKLLMNLCSSIVASSCIFWSALGYQNIDPSAMTLALGNILWLSSCVSSFLNQLEFVYMDSGDYDVFAMKHAKLMVPDPPVNKIQINGGLWFFKDDRYIFNLKNGLYVMNQPNGAGKTSTLNALFFRDNRKVLEDKVIFLTQEQKAPEQFQGKSAARFIRGSKAGPSVRPCLEMVAWNFNKYPTNKVIKHPSGGEKQKLKIAKQLYLASQKDIKLVIFDEPSNNIDYNGQKSIMAALEEMAQSKVVILVTHDNSLFVKENGDMIFYDNLDLADLQKGIFPDGKYPPELISGNKKGDKKSEEPEFDDEPAE